MEPKPRNWRRILFFAAVIIFFLAAGTIITMVIVVKSVEVTKNQGLFGGGCMGSPPYKPDLVQQVGRFKLPASANNLTAYSAGLQSCVVYVSFDIPPADLDPFLQSTYIKDLPKKGGTPEAFRELPKNINWDYDPTVSYSYAQGTTSRPGLSESQVIALDDHDPNRYTIYLITQLQSS